MLKAIWLVGFVGLQLAAGCVLTDLQEVNAGVLAAYRQNIESLAGVR